MGPGWKDRLRIQGLFKYLCLWEPTRSCQTSQIVSGIKLLGRYLLGVSGSYLGMQFHLKNSGNCLGGQVGCLLQWDLHSRGRKLCWVSTWEKPSAASQKTTEFHADTNLLGGPFGSILDSPSETELTLCQQNTSSGSWLISTLVSYLQSEAKKPPGQWLFIGVYTSTVRNQAANWCKYFADAEGEHFIPEDAKQLVELPLRSSWCTTGMPAPSQMRQVDLCC